jgi:hypothetical protein
LIDVSPSTEYKIEEIQSAAIAFVDQLKPHDKVMVIQFDERVSVLAEATNDRQKIHKRFGARISAAELRFTKRLIFRCVESSIKSKGEKRLSCSLTALTRLPAARAMKARSAMRKNPKR